MTKPIAQGPVDVTVRRVAGEVVGADDINSRAQAALSVAAHKQRGRTEKIYGDCRILVRALAKCAEIRSYAKRQQFVLSTLEALKETPNVVIEGLPAGSPARMEGSA